MSKRLSQGKGDEFARAVRSLLGLDAFNSAIDHLKKAVKEYDKQYDARSDSKIEEYTRQISIFEQQIEKIVARLKEIGDEETSVTETIGELQVAIEKNKMSAELSEKKKKLIARREALIAQKSRNIAGLLSTLKRAPAFFAKKMMHDSLQQLTETRKTDKSVPFVNAQTIQHLIERGRCICGAEVCTGNDACNALTELFNYVPPKSIGDSITDFREKCKERVRASETMFEDFETRYADVCAFDSEYAEVLQDIEDVEKQLLGMDDVGKLQADLKRYETHLRTLHTERSECERRMGGLETECKRMETERDKLTLKDDNNRRVTI
jgi:DNA sulfur modification protein DndD